MSFAAPAFAEPDFLAAVRRDTEALARHDSRVVGTVGHDLAACDLLAAVRDIPGLRVWTDEFTVVVPRTHDASLTICDGPLAGVHAVYPLWPAGARLNTTPAEGMSGRLVYVGEGRPSDLPARLLRGQIAVMEASGGENWTDAVAAGAAAVLLVGSPAETGLAVPAHLLAVPVGVPRLYLPDGPLADGLRRGRAGDGRLLVRAAWTETTATNIYILAPTAPGSAPGRALALAAAYDSMSIVPDLAPGADGALDAALALNYLRRLAARPPARPVLVALVDAFGMNQRGVREMLASLSTLPRERLAYRQEDERLARRYRRDEALAARLGADGRGLERLHALHRYVRDEVDREVVAIDARLHPLRLAADAAAGQDHARLQRQADDLDARRNRFLSVQQAVLTGRVVPLDEQPLAEELLGRARTRIRRQLVQTEARLQAHARRDRLREEVLEGLGLAGDAEKPLAFLLGLDLSDAGVAVGPCPYCRHLALAEAPNAMPLIRWLSEIQRREADALWPGDLGRAVNLGPLRGLDEPESYVPGDTATLTSPAWSFGAPGLTWATLDAVRERTDTPSDRAERLDWDRLAPQVEATVRLLDRMVGPDGFAPDARVAAQWKRISGVIVDQAPGQPVARLPMDGYLTVLVNGRVRGPQGFPTWLRSGAGVRRQEFRFSGADGRADFDLMPAEVGADADRTRGELTGLYVQAYDVGPDGRLRRAVDMLKGGRGVRLTADLRSREDKPMRAVVFTAGELVAMEFFDPRFLQDLRLGAVLEARGGNRPRRLNFALERGVLSAHLEHRLRWQLVLRSGITRNSIALLNVLDPREHQPLSPRDLMRGFALGEPLPDHPMLVAARDFYRLDERRLADYARAGVRSRPIEALHEETGRLLAEADAAARTQDQDAFGGGRALAAATGALANEIRAYQAVRDMADDVVRGAVLLLLALVPFSFAMERLLVATPRIYRQLAAVGAIFAAMTAVLWSFHPAFRLSGQPLMIVMAFAILLMSLLVLSVVYGRFEAGLEEARSGRAESSGARTSRLGVLATAVRLGIANMRKRKFRTALTGLVIVLVTFALLCFVSASSYVGQRRRALAEAAPYTGVLVRPPGRRPMPEKAVAYLETVVGPGRVVPRYWWISPRKTEWRIHVRHARTGRQVSLQAALGLGAAERGLTAVAAVCPDWDRFAALERAAPGGATAQAVRWHGHPAHDSRAGSPCHLPLAAPGGVRGGCYLARAVAEELGAAAGDELVVAGRPVELVGAFDPARFDREVLDLDGEALRPIDFSAIGADQRTLLSSEDVDVVASEAEALEPESGLPSVPSSGLLVLPAGLVRGLRDARLRSMAVAAAGHEEAEALAMRLARRLALPVYYGSGRGAAVVVTTPLLARAPKGLLVPLGIAALILLNTMLSGIADRKREIYIYTSLGLAPIHVAALFLAEAAVYGLMGSIFGYVVGQGLATALARLGWLGSLTLNYSGTQAVAVMLMVLGVVVVSALVPALLAGRMAVPSHRMAWAVPRPVGDRIRDTLPFTVTGRTSGGVLWFLLEYFDAHREGSIGHFAADAFTAVRSAEWGARGEEAAPPGFAKAPPGFAKAPPGGRPGAEAAPPPLIGLEGTVWLAPFDLGVRQHVRLRIRPTEAGPPPPEGGAEPPETIYEIDIELAREAGQERSWWNLNRVFLGDLRRQLLGWRKLRLDRILDYIRRAAEEAGPSPGPARPGPEHGP